MEKARGALTTLTSCALLVAGCSEELSPPTTTAEPAELGQACVATRDCHDGLTCFRAVCRQTCAAHVTCAAGERCVGGVCLVASITCPDGVVDVGEACDDGNSADDDGCRNDCTLPVCGDAVVRADLLDPNAPGFESCDDGNTVDDGNGCGADCRVNAVCGDSARQALYEECDDGNTDSFDGCSADCRRLIWSASLDTTLAELPMTAWDYGDPTVEVVAVASADGELIAVDRLSGAVRWRYEAGAALVGPPVVGTERRVALLTSDGVVHGLRLDGRSAPFWQTSLPGVGSALAAAGAPRVWYVADGGGVLHRILEDGTDAAWRTFGGATVDASQRTVPATCGDCAPLIPNAGMFQETAVIVPSGENIWLIDLYDSGGPCDPYLLPLDPGETIIGGLSFLGDSQAAAYGAADKAYAATSTGRILQGIFEHTAACTGAIRIDWSWQASGTPVAAPLIADLADYRLIVYATTDGGIVALHTTAAEPVPTTAAWTYDTGGALAASPTLDADGQVYAVTTAGVVHAIGADGAGLWQYTLPGAPVAGPLLRGGTVYVATTDGGLFALEAGVTDAPVTWWSRQHATNGNTSSSSNCGQVDHRRMLLLACIPWALMLLWRRGARR